LAKRLLEEVPVEVETDEEAVRRSVGEDEPGAVADDDGDDAGPDEGPAAPGDQLTSPTMA